MTAAVPTVDTILAIGPSMSGMSVALEAADCL